MQSILNLFKNRYFWIAVGFALLIALTLFAGEWFGWTMVTQLLIIIGLLVVCIGVVAYEFIQASRSAQKIEQSIKQQAEQQRMNSRPDKQAEIQELQERLEEAIAKLKQSKLGRGRRSNAALHALPWYMFIGPPGAGKTTAIQNSGLNFPIGTDGVRGVGGTRNCDWFFTDQAILLDTAGRYMTEQEDEEEWHAFLEMLKEHRTGRPINGVLVGISIDELVDAAPNEVEWHANNIRRRVSELVEKLGVRFPVYVVFTKCDLLQGFVEFFRDMTRQERQQIWGCTLTEEQREEGSPRALFEKEFERLKDSLIDTRFERLSRSMKREDRRKVYTFPLQFASAKENLSFFIDQLFQENPYQENPEFRGFYFTSGTQEGAPIDHVIQSVSEEFNFATGLEESAEPETETKSYFLKNLFTEAVIPDQYMVEQTSSAARWERLLRWGIGAAAAVVLGLIVVGLSQALWRSLGTLDEVEEAAQAAASVQWDGQNTSEDLKKLTRLQDKIDELTRYQEDPPLLQSGLYRGGTVLPPARSLYYRTLRPLVRERFKALETKLSNAASVTQEERSALRDQLENYLLLADSSQALRQDRYRDQLTQYLTRRMTQPTGSASTVSFEGYGGQVQSHMKAYVDGLREGRVEPFEVQPSTVERVTRLVNRPPTIRTIYDRIKEKGASQFSPVTLTSMLESGISLFANPSQVKVSGFFTQRAWNNFVEEQIKQAAKTPTQDGLIGGGSEQLSENLRDPETVRKKLRERYFGDYAAAWKKFLNSVEYRSFGNLRSTAEALQTLGDQYNSPILYVLGGVTNQTQFRSAIGAAAKSAKKQAQEEAARRAEGAVQRQTGVRADAPNAASSETSNVHPVNRRMKSLHRLKPIGPDGPSENLKQALGVLREVGRKLDGIRNDRRTTYDFAKRVLAGDQLDQQMSSLRSYLSQISPEVRRELFERPIREGWTAVLGRTQRYLNARWNEEVYSFYQANLEGRYPVSGSPNHVPLATFKKFFRPQDGKLAAFYQNLLSSFLREDQYRPKTWEGQGIQVSPSMVQALERAEQIRNELFSGGFGLQFKLVPYQPKREGNAPAPGRVTIRAHGTKLVYRLGARPEKRFQWPGTSRGAMVRITTNAGTVGPIEASGPWAWFRMLEKAKVTPESPTDYRLEWRFAPSDQYTLTAIYDLRDSDALGIYANPGETLRFSPPETLD
ncbi:MAG: type VI secretion system membrane subunit TssM [Salinibacter sp.]|uniref:type VI secretion system membrane subunit TssM n=1 Tax=Salinibacter sp. TaxID=2065818 RepID=UPI0035D444D1